MKTGVIVGRFQNAGLHNGHIHLIDTVIKKCNKLVIILPDSEKLNARNPLPGWIRATMIRDFLSTTYKGLDFMILCSTSNGTDLSIRVDKLISEYPNITIYGSRDSFISFYNGVHQCEIIPELDGVSATSDRQQLLYENTESFRKGIIYTFEKLFKRQ